MDIECPKCFSKGQLDDEKTPAVDFYATCHNCKTKFLVKPCQKQDAVTSEVDTSSVVIMDSATTCPSCKYSSDQNDCFTMCPRCGLIIAKYYKYKINGKIQLISNLIKCYICHNKMSINAATCPSCGEPSIFNAKKTSLLSKGNALVIVILLVCFSLLMSKLNSISNGQPTAITPQPALITPPTAIPPPLPKADVPTNVSPPGNPAPIFYPVPITPRNPATDNSVPAASPQKPKFNSRNIGMAYYYLYWYKDEYGNKCPRFTYKLRNSSELQAENIVVRVAISDERIGEIIDSVSSVAPKSVSSYRHVQATRNMNDFYSTLAAGALSAKIYIKSNDNEERTVSITQLPYHLVLDSQQVTKMYEREWY